MAEFVLIYGKSGTGKTRSLINFGEEEIFLVNVLGKRMPFQKKFKYELKTDDVEKIKEKLVSMPTDTAVIDDAGYLMTNKFMKSHGKGNQFDLFNDIADGFWNLIQHIKYVVPENKVVYIMMHEDASDMGEVKLRTIGKLLDQKVCIEGMATCCLHSVKKDSGYVFITQNQGNDITKSPEGMFEAEEPNDLKAIDTKLRNFWGLEPEKKVKK